MKCRNLFYNEGDACAVHFGASLDIVGDHLSLSTPTQTTAARSTVTPRHRWPAELRAAVLLL